MDYGNKCKHVSSPEDRTILTCMSCGWEGEFLSSDLGTPWYCGNCGKKVYHFIRFAPDEREEAYRRQAQWRPSFIRYGVGVVPPNFTADQLRQFEPERRAEGEK